MTQEELLEECVLAADLHLYGQESRFAERVNVSEDDKELYYAGVYAGVIGTMRTLIDLGIIEE